MFFAVLLALSKEEVRTPTGLTVDELSKKLDDYINPLLKYYLPSAVIKISKDKETILEKAYGCADCENNISATNETLYEWGSVTKIATHVAIWQLYEEGKVDLNADIQDYIGKDFFGRRKYDDKITILNLMHHNAGWDEYTLSFYSPKRVSIPNLREYLQHVEPRQFARPNEFVSYSNYGVGVEALVVEAVTGKKFSQYVKENIFQRLGMNHSSIDPSRNDVDKYDELPHAISYSALGEKFEYQDSVPYVYPAGSMVSSIEDLSAFINDLVPIDGEEPKLFKNIDSLRSFLTVSYRPSKDGQGLVHGLWEIFDENKSTVVSHGGNTLSMSSHVFIHPTSGWSACVLTSLYAESFVTTKLPILLFGIYNNTYNGSNIERYEGKFVSTRGIHSGFLAIMGNINTLFGVAEIKKKSMNTLLAAGSDLYQIEDNLFITKMTETEYIPPIYSTYSFTMKDGNIKGMYATTSELEKIDGIAKYVGTLIGVIIWGLSLALGVLVLIPLYITCCCYSSSQKSINQSRPLMKYSYISTLLVFINFIALIIVLVMIGESNGFPERNLFTELTTSLIVFNVIRWVIVIFSIALMVYDYKKPNNNDNIELPNVDLINQDDEIHEPEKKSYKVYKVFIAIPMVCSIIINIVGYCLDAYRV